MENIENAGAYLLNLIVQVMAWIFEHAFVIAIVCGVICLVSVAVEIRKSRKDQK